MTHTRGIALPRLIVATDITHPTRHNFYLQSHGAIQGSEVHIFACTLYISKLAILLFRFPLFFNLLPSFGKAKSGKSKKLIIYVYNYVTRSIYN